jgi:hypothetical protein
MITILVLIGVGITIGVNFHWGVLALCTFLLVLWQIATWFIAAKFNFTGLLMLIAYIFALQSGYLFGGYLLTKIDD